MGSFYETEFEIRGRFGIVATNELLCLKKAGMSSGPDAEDYLEGDLSQVSQSSFLIKSCGGLVL